VRDLHAAFLIQSVAVQACSKHYSFSQAVS